MLRIQPKISTKVKTVKPKFTPEQEELIRLNGARFEEPLLFVHTKKAVNNGNPDDRLFLVIGYGKEDPEQDGSLRDPMTGRWIKSLYFQAWKCIITSDGVGHPEFRDKFPGPYKPLPVDVLIKKGNIMGKRSEPTAFFKPDSFYKQITVEELKQLVSNVKVVKKPDEAQIAIAALSKLTPTERKVLRTGKYL